MQGWIKLHRRFRDNPYYKEPNAKAVWLECLLRAQHNDGERFLKRQKVKLKAGQFVMGREEFGESIGLSGSTAWYWIQQFSSDSMVDIKTSTKGTIITVLKWESYQLELTAPLTTNEQQKNSKKTHNKNVKKEKNVKKSTTNVVEAPPDDEWKKRLNPDVQWVMDEYESVFGRKSKGNNDRRFAKHLIDNYAREQITAMMQYCANDQYAPRVGSVQKIWYKRGQIEEGIRKTYNQNKQKVTFAV